MGKIFKFREEQAIQLAPDLRKHHSLRLVHNAGHSKTSEKTGSMIQYWEEQTGRQLDKEEYTCPHCHQKVKRDKLDGSHVICIDEPERQYLVPLCDIFNESKDTETLFFVPEADLVIAP